MNGTQKILKSKINTKNKELKTMEKELAEINQALVEKDSKFDEIDDEQEFIKALHLESDEVKMSVNEMIDKYCKNMKYKFHTMQEDALKETQKEKESLKKQKEKMIKELMKGPYTLYYKRLESSELDTKEIEFFKTVIDDTIEEIFGSDGEIIVPKIGDTYNKETMEISSSGNKTKEGSGLDLVVRERKKVGYQIDDFIIKAEVSVEDPKSEIDLAGEGETEENSSVEINEENLPETEKHIMAEAVEGADADSEHEETEKIESVKE